VAASPLALRWLTLFAVGFLAFDGAALSVVGLWSGRTGLVAAGVVLFLSSGVVLLVWRQHLRRLHEIGEARRELRDEAEELRRLLKS
jgi:membrane protein implicated in regulation of membrane protease activity